MCSPEPGEELWEYLSPGHREEECHLPHQCDSLLSLRNSRGAASASSSQPAVDFTESALARGPLAQSRGACQGSDAEQVMLDRMSWKTWAGRGRAPRTVRGSGLLPQSQAWREAGGGEGGLGHLLVSPSL